MTSKDICEFSSTDVDLPFVTLKSLLSHTPVTRVVLLLLKKIGLLLVSCFTSTTLAVHQGNMTFRNKNRSELGNDYDTAYHEVRPYTSELQGDPAR
jgi:hypothetical protein